MTDKPSCRIKTSAQANELDSLITMGRGITHDYNNLLTAIKGNAFLIRHTLGDNAVANDSITQIETCTERALELLNKISIYTGNAQFIEQSTNINDLLAKTCKELHQPHIEIPTIKFNLEATLAPINVDSDQLQKLIRNLIVNSAEAMIEKEGCITITTGLIKKEDIKEIELTYPEKLDDSEYLFIRIQDVGKGIPIKIQKKIFTPFFTTKIRGEGLGLSTVLGVIRSHSGALIVNSRAHKGSAFTVIIPTTQTKQI